MDLTTDGDRKTTSPDKTGLLEGWGQDRVSFRDKLTNIKLQEKKRDDFEIKDDDVVVAMNGEFPTVSFSDRVHNYLSQSMKNFVIIQLLDRVFGY